MPEYGPGVTLFGHEVWAGVEETHTPSGTFSQDTAGDGRLRVSTEQLPVHSTARGSEKQQVCPGRVPERLHQARRRIDPADEPQNFGHDEYRS